MPELPEVETVRTGLAPAMEGIVIAQADVNRPDLRWPFPDGMADRLTGQKVLRLRRRSKYILADLSSGETLLIHLGMSGRMTVSGDPLGRFVHDHPAAQNITARAALVHGIIICQYTCSLKAFSAINDHAHALHMCAALIRHWSGKGQ